MDNETILIVDDEAIARENLAHSLGKKGYRVLTAADGTEAIERLADTDVGFVLTDLRMQTVDGLEVLARAKRLQPDAEVVVITGYASVETAVEAMRRGAYHYIAKPIQIDELCLIVAKALEKRRLKKEIRDLRRRVADQSGLERIVGQSQAILALKEMIRQVAALDCTVLVSGETGTGKELVAGAIHYQSPNFKGPFTAVNCAAIPTELIESELFGYEKGAFSGAGQTKPGLIEAAAEGTLFLDEIGDLNAAAQAKLLRFLETGEFYRVGGTRRHTIRTRVVSATNQDLDALMADGRFRQDLYFRLGVIRVAIPALNARPGDILPLTRHFLEVFNQKFGKAIRGLSPEAVQALENHRWTGNVRELRNVIERAVLLAGDERIEVEDLDLGSAPICVGNGFAPLPTDGLDLPAALAAMERFYIEAALRRTDGNESRAARLLGLNHHTFRYQRRKLGA